MPYSIVARKHRFYVKGPEGLKPKGGYGSKAEARKYLAALEANVGERDEATGPDIPTAALSTTRNCNWEAVRSTPDGKLKGYLAIWGAPNQKDCLGTYFDKDRPPAMDLGFVPFPFRYDHGKSAIHGKGTKGRVSKVWLDDKGIAFEGELDPKVADFPTILNEIQQGILAISTGTPEYLAEFAEDGRFVTWPIGADVSLTSHPCEFRMPAVAQVRSLDSKHIEL